MSQQVSVLNFGGFLRATHFYGHIFVILLKHKELMLKIIDNFHSRAKREGPDKLSTT